MSNKPPLYEVLKVAAEQEFVEDSIVYLQRYDTYAIRLILKMLYDPKIKFHKDLPHGKTPYNPSKFDEPGRLYSEMRRMYLFVQEPSLIGQQSAPVNLTSRKRQELWIQMLESLSPGDAELMDAVKDKETPWKRISRHLTKKAYPGLLDD